MVTINGDGAFAVVANEGEPAEDYAVDPEGTVSVVTLPGSLTVPPQSAVRTADFHAFEGAAVPDGIRVYGGRADAGTGRIDVPRLGEPRNPSTSRSTSSRERHT